MDIRLVVQAQSGDEDAFSALMEAVIDRFHGVACNLLRDRDLAADAVQSALVRVWRDLPGLRDPERFEAWSYRLLVNACHSESRRMRRWMPNVVGAPIVEPSGPDATGPVADRDRLERGFAHQRGDSRVIGRAAIVERVKRTLGADHRRSLGHEIDD